MILTVRTTTGRENAVIDSLSARVKKGALIKSAFHPEDLSGYIFVEGEQEGVEAAIKGLPHVRGIINKNVPIEQLEKFLIAEKSEIKIESGDIVEIVGGPFRGEKGRVTRVD